jgi:hypothetical protein
MKTKMLLLAGLFLCATFVILWQIGSGVQHMSRVVCEKECMVVIQKCAEKYAKANGGSYPASYRELSPFLPGGSKHKGGKPGSLPPNYINGVDDTNYLFDLQKGHTEELLAGNISSLETERKPGGVGYGATANQAAFAIVGFDSADRKSAPLEGPHEPVLILVRGGEHIHNMPGAQKDQF